jgi:tRNA modification GTPase
MPDTIVALATPTGRSSIGVIRLSGDDSLAITRKLTNDDFSPEPRTAHLKQLFENGEVLDEAVVTWFKAPHSFTGEDVAEVSCHGSPVVLRRVIDICLNAGARMAEPGEFSLRALANGQLDLAEAEAIRDLIEAQTVASARQAIRQLRGEFSHELQPIKDALLDAIVVLESALEFVEDDLPPAELGGIKVGLESIATEIGAIADTFKAGKLIREGLKVAIVGRPNVGKSSLFNRLLGTDRAIVTDIAGTTRDQLHERFTIGDIPISLIDTAGLRDTQDTVESIGVERSKRTMADADLVVVMLDASEPVTGDDQIILDSVKDLNHIVAVNKIDLPSAECGVRNAESDDLQLRTPHSALRISARTGQGIDELQQAIVKPFSSEETATSGFLVSDARHHDLLQRARSEIQDSLELLDKKTSEEIVLIGLHNAMRFLGQITGETTTEDMLTRIFSTFCIGK